MTFARQEIEAFLSGKYGVKVYFHKKGMIFNSGNVEDLNVYFSELENFSFPPILMSSCLIIKGICFPFNSARLNTLDVF